MGINLRLAFKALACNRLQALLTLSGMSFGVAMVVIVSGLGSGAQQRIEAQIEAAGPTLITLRSGNLRPAAIVTSGEQDTSGGEVSEGALPATGLDGTQDVVGNSAIDDARQRAIAPRQLAIDDDVVETFGKLVRFVVGGGVVDLRGIEDQHICEGAGS